MKAQLNQLSMIFHLNLRSSRVQVEVSGEKCSEVGKLLLLYFPLTVLFLVIIV